MKYILPVNTYDEWVSPRAEFASVEITKETAHWLLAVIERAGELKSEYEHFYSMEIFHNLPVWYEWHDDLEDICNNTGQANKLPQGLDEVQVECVTLVAYNNAVRWMASIEHTSVYCDTEHITKSELEAIVG